MTYHSAVSGIAMMGLSGGLGGDIIGHDVTVRWQPGPGLGQRTAEQVFEKIKNAIKSLDWKFANSDLRVGYGDNNTFYAKMDIPLRGATTAADVRRLFTLQSLAVLMRDIGEAAVAGTGFTLSFLSIKDEDTGGVVSAASLPARRTSTPSGEGLYTPSTPPTAPPGPQLSTPPQAPPSTTVTVKLLQQRLIAAGVRLQGGDDGRWGSNTKTALESFAASKGITLPVLGSRSDYVQSGANVTIPAALAAALPAPSGGSSTGRRTPRDSEPASPDEQPPGGSETLVPEATGSKLPWGYIGAGVGIALLAAAFMLSRRVE